MKSELKFSNEGCGKDINDQVGSIFWALVLIKINKINLNGMCQ
jgi:hypothetical protein